MEPTTTTMFGAMKVAVPLVGAASALLLATDAPGEGSTTFTLLWGLLLGSIGMSALGILWGVWQRTRAIVVFLIDKGFDRVQRRIGMEPGDMPAPPTTPIDTYLKGTSNDPDD